MVPRQRIVPRHIRYPPPPYARLAAASVGSSVPLISRQGLQVLWSSVSIAQYRAVGAPRRVSIRPRFWAHVSDPPNETRTGASDRPSSRTLTPLATSAGERP